MNLLKILKNILIFFRLFYWLALKESIRAFLNGNLQMNHKLWAKQIVKYMGITFHKFQSQPLVEDQKIIYLVNHRSQADFFVHDIVLNHNQNMLSRLAVAIVFPVFGLASRGTTWYFNRSGNINADQFNAWLDSKFLTSIRKGLLVYPQGHRMYNTKQVKSLKTGLIRYAFRRSIPVQLAMSFGNEQILNEKKLQFCFGKTVYYQIGKKYDPKDYKSEQQFVQDMKLKFTDFFAEVYAKYEAQVQKTEKKQV